MAFSKTSPGTCKDCYNQRKRTWRLANVSKQKSSERKWLSKESSREAHKRAMARWYEEHKEQLKPKRRSAHLVRNYGIGEQDYQRMYVEQGGKCAICSRWFDVLCIDHDHTTGQIRQLLCRQHNAAIGWFDEDPRLLLRAAEYLLRWCDSAQPLTGRNSGHSQSVRTLDFISPTVSE